MGGKKKWKAPINIENSRIKRVYCSGRSGAIRASASSLKLQNP
jgi:hypothetical protein